MEQIAIGKSGLMTSRIGLGTWAMGGWMWGGTDEAQSIATIRSAIDRGVTLIDTAPVYGFGRSEEIVGKALEGSLRHKVTIATKVGLAWKDGAVYRDSRPARIRTGDRGFAATAAHGCHRPLSGALAGLRDADCGDRADVGRPAPRGQDSGDRRQQFFANPDAYVQRRRPARRRAAALQSL